MDELRSWWEVPSIAFFCQVFREPLNLPEFDIEELEESILLSATPEGSETLTSLICILLRGCLGRRDIERYNCDVYLRKLLSKRWSERSSTENPMTESDFRQLQTRTKVEILYELCQWRLLSDDSGDLIKDYDGDALRVSPIGSDEKGSSYWYFMGTRLYKETPVLLSSGSRKKKDGPGQRKASTLSKKMHAKKKRKGARKKFTDKQVLLPEQPSQATEDVPPAQWQLACSTLDEWQALADSFSSSKARCERDLHKRLTDEFLVIIPKIIEEKERIMRKKLLEMAPKRTSSRLQHKKQEYEEQLKIIEQLELDEKMELERMQEEQRRAAEEERRLAAARAREERQRLKEERAQRALLREMRASLVAEGKEIPPELLALDSPVPAAADGAETALPPQTAPPDSADHDEDDLDTKLSRVLTKIRRHKNAWPFLEPVPETLAPDYYTVIVKPMDLSKMEAKLRKKEYSCRREFEGDFNRMIENCQLYNGPSSDYTMLALGLQEAFTKVVEKCFAPKKPRVHLSNVCVASTGPAGSVPIQAVNGHAELAATVALNAIKAGGQLSGLHGSSRAVAPAAAAAAAARPLAAGPLPTGSASGVVQANTALSASPAASPALLTGKIGTTPMAAGTLLTAIASNAARSGLYQPAEAAPVTATRPVIVKPRPADPVPLTSTAVTAVQPHQHAVMLLVDPRAQQPTQPQLIGSSLGAQQQQQQQMAFLKGVYSSAGTQAPTATPIAREAGLSPAASAAASAAATVAMPVNAVATPAVAAATAAGGAWPVRQVVIVSRPAATAAAPLAGWRTVASTSSLSGTPAAIRPAAGLVAAGAVQPAAAITGSPTRLPSSERIVMRLVNQSSAGSTDGGAAAAGSALPAAAAVVNSGIRQIAPGTTAAVRIPAATGSGVMTLASIQTAAASLPSVSRVTSVSSGIAGSTSLSSDGGRAGILVAANGLKPVDFGPSRSAMPAVAAGHGVGSLLVLNNAWVPSHLNLPGGSSSSTQNSNVPAAAVAVPVPAAAVAATGGGEAYLKRSADTTDCDKAAKRLAVSTSSVTLSGASIAFR